ncbi:DUF4244 domain-containing protein [Actinacidiphila alni]|uniref:DUF4244 domain-containing protein n=1 Tax=Actinacidiphila alni TaxID=380248 RepID=UPI003F5063DD
MTRHTTHAQLAPTATMPITAVPATAMPTATMPVAPVPIPRAADAVRKARADRRRYIGRLRRRAARCRDATRSAAEAGMSTAEYAVGTIAACGFAAVLYKIVTSGPVHSALNGVIVKALHVPF